MPIMKPANMLPDWADPAQSSVMDPLYKQLARRAVSAMGLDDPTSSIMQAAAPSVSPLVSIFKDKAEREVGTSAFRKLLDALPESWRAAGHEFANEYPRVAAHMQPEVVAPEPSRYLNGAPSGAYARVSDLPKRPAQIGINQDVISNSLGRSNPQGEAKQVFTHEGTHVAQRLGNSDFTDLYEAAHRLAGYEANPFEASARASAGETGGYSAKITNWGNLRTEVEQKLKDLGISLDSSHGGNSVQLKLRKWGAESLPENYIQSSSLPPELQSKIADLAKGPDNLEVGYRPAIQDLANKSKAEINHINQWYKADDPSNVLPQDLYQKYGAAKNIQDILAARAAKGWTPSGQ